MARASGELLWLLLALVALARVAWATTTFIVGDDEGWTIPSAANGLNYSAWAAQHTFTVGDILHFQYTPGAHNVQPLPSKASLAACDFSVTTVPALIGGSNDITLKTARDHWYACSLDEHCQSGMKFKISVVSNVTWSLAPAPAPEGHASSPGYYSDVESPAPTPVAGGDAGPYYHNSGSPVTNGLTPEPVPSFAQAGTPVVAPDASAYFSGWQSGWSPVAAPAPGYEFDGSFEGSTDVVPYETIPDPISGA